MQIDSSVNNVDAGDDIVNDLGFTIRTPGSKEFDCGDLYGQQILNEADWLCTFEYDDQSGHIYMQNNPVECIVTLSYYPRYESIAAFAKIGDSVEPLANPSHDWGGNHNNDSLSFDYGGKHFQYDHSSFGFGFRQCQPMDCMRVYESAGGALIKDGCTSARTLPIVCVPVEAGESYDSGDFVDTFAKCPGDDS